MSLLTPEIEAKCLALGDPEDIGECEEFRYLSDGFVNGKKWYPCAHCGRSIRPGERQRSMRFVIDGEVWGCRYCDVCCAWWVESENAPEGEQGDAAWDRHIYSAGFGKALETWLSIGPHYPQVNS